MCDDDDLDDGDPGARWETILEGSDDGHRHVLPIDDLRAHVEAVLCWCEPAIEEIRPGLLIVTHHALDGRELVERHGVQ